MFLSHKTVSKEMYLSHKTINKAITIKTYLFHNTITIKIYLFHKTSSKNTIIKSIPILQDHQPKYNTKRRLLKPTSTPHHYHSKGPNQQPDMPVSNPITGPQPETTTDQLLQYLIAINGHSTIKLSLAVL